LRPRACLFKRKVCFKAQPHAHKMGDMDENERRMSTLDVFKGLFRCAVSSLRGGSAAAAAAASAEMDAAQRQRVDDLVERMANELRQINLDLGAEKSRLQSMHAAKADKFKMMNQLRTIKRLEARIAQKTKLMHNTEASADSASDAQMVIETALLQKDMLGAQKKTLKNAFNGVDVEDLVDEIQEHHEDVQDISQTLADMNLGGLGGSSASADVTEEDLAEWMREEDDMAEVAMMTTAATGGGVLPAVPSPSPSSSSSKKKGVQVMASAAATAAAGRSKKQHRVPLAL